MRHRRSCCCTGKLATTLHLGHTCCSYRTLDTGHCTCTTRTAFCQVDIRVADYLSTKSKRPVVVQRHRGWGCLQQQMRLQLITQQSFLLQLRFPITRANTQQRDFHVIDSCLYCLLHAINSKTRPLSIRVSQVATKPPAKCVFNLITKARKSRRSRSQRHSVGWSVGRLSSQAVRRHSPFCTV